MNRKRIAWCKRNARYFASVPLVAGLMGFAGSLFGISTLLRIFPNLPAMKPLAVVFFICASLSFIIMEGKRSRFRIPAGIVLAILAFVTASAKLGLFFLGESAGGGGYSLLHALKENTTSVPNGGLAYLLLGIALLARWILPPSRQIVTQAFATAALAVTCWTLVGFVYEFYPLRGADSYRGMCIHATFGAAFLSVALLFSTADSGFMPVVLSDTQRGLLIRNNSVVILAVIFLLACVAIMNSQQTLLGLRTSFPLFASLTIVLLIAVSSTYAWFLYRNVDLYTRSEAIRHRTETEFTTLFELATVGMAQIDARTGRFVRANAKYCELTGYSEEELLRMTPTDLSPPEEAAAGTNIPGNYLSGRTESYSSDKRYVRKNGEIVWVHITASVIRDENGELTGSIGMIEDISERKNSEQALRASEARERARASELQAIMDNVPAIIWIGHDAECRNITGSRSAYEFLRIPYGENSSKTSEGEGARTSHFRILSNGKVLEEHELPMQQAALDGKPIANFEEAVEFDDGTVRSIIGNATPLFDEAGAVRGAVGAFLDITRLKEAEERIRRSEAQLRVVLEHLPIGVWILDEEGGVIFGNRAACEIWGEEKVHPGRRENHFKIRIHGTDRFYSAENLPSARCLESKQPILDEIIDIELLDGTRKTIQVSCIPIKDDSGGIISIVAVNEDITMRTNAEMALRENEKRFRNMAAIVENSDDAIFGRTIDGIITSWNAGAERIYGYSAEEMIGGTLEIVFPEELLHEHKAILHRLNRGERIQQLETQRLRKDGELIHVSLTVSPIRNHYGQMVGISTIARDITDIKRAEQALRESEHRFRVMADAAPVLIWVADEHRSFEYVNSQLLEFTGRTIEQAVGRGWTQSIHPVDREYVERIRESAYELHLPFHIEYRLRNQEGEYRWIFDQGTPRFEPDGTFAGFIGSCIDIHERKKSEEESARLAVIVETSHDAIIGKNLDGTVTSWNAGAQRVYGYSAEEMIGQSIEKLVPPEYHAEFEQILQCLKSGERIEQVNTKRRRKDGTIIDVSLTISPLVDSQGNISAASIIARDITELNRWIMALRESESRFRAMADAAPALIWMADTTKACTYFNRQWLEFTGRTIEEEYGDGWAENIHPEDLDYCLALFNSAFDLREPFRMEFRLRHRSGDYRWLIDHGEPRFAPNGTFEGYIGSCIDINERIAAEHALKQSEEEYRATFELAGVGKVQVEAATLRLIRVNRKMCEMLKYAPEELMMMTMQDVTHPDDRERDYLNMQKLLQGEIAEYSTEKRYLRKDGTEMWGSVTATVIRDAEGRPLRAVAVVQDISDRRTAEEMRRKLESQFQQVQKLESLGILAGGIAHDFNNLLVGILGNAGMAAEDLSPQSPALENINGIEMAARHAADLCRQMLAYSGKGRFVIEAISINDIIVEMSHLLSVSISRNAMFRMHLADNLPLVDADVTQLRQVVMNLIINASEALDEKPGLISVSTGAADCDEEYLKQTVLNEELPAGLYVYLEVSDTGSGMTAEVQQRIFDPFYTTKFTGRGLGLAAVLGIVRGHKGAIRLSSEPGRGTTFRVLFPAAPAAAKQIPYLETEIGSHHGGTILLVDDSDTVRAVGRRMLEKAGFDVFTADDGISGVEVYQERAEEIDCVVLDLTMPRMNGDEALRLMREIRKDVRVVLSSGYNEQEVIMQFEGQNFSGFVQKPYQASDLIAKINAAISSNVIEDDVRSSS